MEQRTLLCLYSSTTQLSTESANLCYIIRCNALSLIVSGFTFNINALFVQVNQVILAKKRRLSQTDSGKSRKPTTQASMAVMPITVSDSRQEIIVNGNGIHTPTDVTVEDPSQTKDNVSNTKPPSVVSATDTNDAATSSPEESHQMVATCSGNGL